MGSFLQNTRHIQLLAVLLRLDYVTPNLQSLIGLIFLLLAINVSGQNLIINEVQSSNSISAIDEFDEFDDWIEIHNPTAEDISLSGMFISDDVNNPGLWQLPDDEALIVSAGGYLLLWADGETEQGATHLPFSLGQSGETVYLHDSELNPVSTLAFGFMWQDHSIGINDEQVVAYDLPTPGMENFETYYQGTLSKPLFSEIGGVITEDDINILMTHEIPDVTIHYTLDGSAPNALSPEYDGALDFSFSIGVKAIAIADDWIQSPVQAQSYLFDVEHEVDIIAVSCDEEEFSGPGGLDTAPFSDEEIVVDVNYISEGITQISQTMGMKVHAPDFRDQKSFRLYARGDYGKSRFDYPVFENRELNSYKRLILRNSGNDGTEIAGVGMRDPIIQSFYAEVDPEYGYSSSKPVVMYVNGLYWGLYNLRERQDQFWMEDLYGLEMSEVDFLERTATESDTRNEISGDWDDFDQMENDAINLDLSDTDTYEGFIEQMNVRNFIDYQFLEIYINNQDWLSNNMKFWKPLENGQWNWAIWDTDWGLGTFYPNYPHGFPDWNALSFALSDWGGWTSAVETEILQNLVENEQFVDDFSTRAADLLNSTLRAPNVITRIQDFQESMLPEIDQQLDQWGGISINNWNNEVEYMTEFVTERPDYLRTHYTEMFSLGDILPINLDVDPPISGYFEVNTIVVEDIPWDGLYFEELDVRVKALALPGYVFSHWEGDVDGEEVEIWVDVSEVTDLVAVYESLSDYPDLVISEIFYKSDIDFPSQDWIEIYNAGPGPVDLLEWQLCGDNDCYLFSESAVIQEGEYFIVAEDVDAFTAEYGIAGALGSLEFGLDQFGETLTLMDPFGAIVDLVEYTSDDPWPASVPPGQSIELIGIALDNNIGSNWVSQEIPGGTPGDEYEELIVNVDDMLTSQISAWPNPFKKYILLDLGGEFKGRITLKLTNALGQDVAGSERANVPGSGQMMLSSIGDVSLEDLPKGLYLLTISSEHDQEVIRLMRK